MLLSRVANALYWMSRYIERAENIARFIDVNTQLALDRSAGREEQWSPLISITGDEQSFYQRYGEATRGEVTKYLTIDRAYPNSVVACVAAARENARTVRDVITAEMWRQINQLHLQVQRVADRGFVEDRPTDFYDRVKRGTLLFAGITNATMSRNTAYEFCRLGRMIERADKTSRILDVKYFLLLPRPEDVGTAMDAVQWAALLRSVGGLEMYRKQHGGISPASVAGFLVLDDGFPRSIMHCLRRSEDALARILGTPRFPAVAVPRETADLPRSLGRLRAELEFADIRDIIARGLHPYLDGFQDRLNAFDTAMNRALFHLPATPEPDSELEPKPGAGLAERDAAEDDPPQPRTATQRQSQT